MQMNDERKYEVNRLIRKLYNWRSSLFFHIEHMIEKAFVYKDWEDNEKHKFYSFDSVKSHSISRHKSEDRYKNDSLLSSHLAERKNMYKVYENSLNDLAFYGENENWRELIIKAEKKLVGEILDKLGKLYDSQAKEARKNKKSFHSFEYIVNNFKREHDSKFSDEYTFPILPSIKARYITTLVVYLIGFTVFLKIANFSGNSGTVLPTFLKFVALTLLGMYAIKVFLKRTINIRIHYSNLKIKSTGFLNNNLNIIPWDKIDFYSEEEKKSEYQLRFYSKSKEILAFRIAKGEQYSLKNEQYENFLRELKHPFDRPPASNHIKVKQIKYLTFWEKWILRKEA